MERLILFSILFFIDVSLTYFFIRYAKKKLPKIDWEKAEENIFVKFCWKKFGFFKGTIASIIVIYPIFLFLTFLINGNDFGFGMVVGIYIIVINLHLFNFRDLFLMIKKKKKNESRSEIKGK